jgi:hypothetical protein
MESRMSPGLTHYVLVLENRKMEGSIEKSFRDMCLSCLSYQQDHTLLHIKLPLFPEGNDFGVKHRSMCP